MSKSFRSKQEHTAEEPQHQQQQPPSQTNSDRIAWLEQFHQQSEQAKPIVKDLIQRSAGKGKGDIEREGTISDPKSQQPVSLDTAFAEAKDHAATFGDWLMKRYAFNPTQPNPSKAENTLRIFAPGLNTPEPEASKRTAYYADKLGQSMVHIHNGTNKNSDNPFSEQIDYATAMMTRSGLKETKLMQSLFSILHKSLAGAEAQDIHAILYSDSTIAGSRAIAKVRSTMISERVSKGKSKDTAIQEVETLLRKHLFVEMHGNVAQDLPSGPKYVLWADKKDDITHKKMLPFMPEMGISSSRPDKDADVLYVDYDGPFSGADAHNLQATGVHVVRQTWWANGVRSSQELFDLYKRTGHIKIPEHFVGDSGKLWNPRNNPNWKSNKPKN